MLVSHVMVTDTVQWFWDPAIEWSECLHGGKNIAKQQNSTTGADASGELMQLAEELANCNAVVCS